MQKADIKKQAAGREQKTDWQVAASKKQKAKAGNRIEKTERLKSQRGRVY